MPPPPSSATHLIHPSTTCVLTPCPVSRPNSLPQLSHSNFPTLQTILFLHFSSPYMQIEWDVACRRYLEDIEYYGYCFSRPSPRDPWNKTCMSVLENVYRPSTRVLANPYGAMRGLRGKYPSTFHIWCGSPCHHYFLPAAKFCRSAGVGAKPLHRHISGATSERNC